MNVRKMCILLCCLMSMIVGVCSAKPQEKWVLLDEDAEGLIYLEEKAYGSNYLTWFKNISDPNYYYRVYAEIKTVLKSRGVTIIERNYYFYDKVNNRTAIRKIGMQFYENGKLGGRFRADLNAPVKVEKAEKMHIRFCRLLLEYDRKNAKLLKV